MSSVAPTFIVNGLICQQLPVEMLGLDRGFAYGDGVFETMAYDQGDIPLWQLHFERLSKGLTQLGIPFSTQPLFEHLQATIASIAEGGSEKGVVKLVVTRGTGGRGYLPPETTTPMLLAIIFPAQPVDHNPALTGARVHLCQQRLPRQPVSGIKSLNQLVYVIASQERLGKGLDEGLLLDDKGYIIEATARNLFCIDEQDRLLVPDLSHCGVEGVMRRFIIDVIAPELSLSVKVDRFTFDALLNAKECFLSNSVSRIWPLIACGNHHWEIGSLTRHIAKATDAWLANNVAFSYRHTAKVLADEGSKK